MQSNPYVQQLPLEAMARVGMYKQQKYEEGVQKIQGQIDKVAGLDVIKPLHKQYLQSKLNELGSKLKTVAAGDFSNFQLVNSVGGMASQIGKDSTIQNAVMSTQRLRKEQENIEAAQKAGKSSVNNEDFFNDQYSKWMNDGNLNTTFNSEFVEYKDVDAKFRDLTSKLKEDETGIENPYMRDDSTGATLYYYTDPKTKKQTVSTDPSKGEKRLDLDMLSIKIKGLPAERILNNFYNSLDSNDIRQMKIDSWAHYRGAGPESFKSDITKAYKNKTEMLSQEKIDLGVKLQDPKITGVQKAKIQSRLLEINKDVEDKKLEKEMGEDLLELENPRNLEEFKYKLYTQTHLTNLAKDLSYRSYIQERKANPAEQADLARKKFQFEQIQENNEMYRWRITERRLQSKDDYERLKDSQTKIDNGYRVSPGEWLTGGKAPTISDLDKDLTTATVSYDEAHKKLAQDYFSGDDYKGWTLDQKVNALDIQLSEYRKNPNKDLTPDQRIYLEKLRNEQNGLTKVINSRLSAQVYEKEVRDNWLMKNTKGDKVVSTSGATYNIGDVADFDSGVNKFIETDKFTGLPIFHKEEAIGFFKNFQSGKFLPMLDAYIKDGETFSRMNDDNKKIMSFYKEVKPVASKMQEETNATVSKYIARNNPIYAVQRARIDVTDPKKTKDLDDFLVEKQLQYNASGALDVNNPSDYAPDVSAKIRGDKDSQFAIEKRKDGGANVILFGKDGTRQIIPAQVSEVSRFFPEVAVTSPFQEIQTDIMNSSGRTTNASNKRFVKGSGATAVNAKFSGYQLPQLDGSGFESKVRIDIEGEKSNIGEPESDLYTVIMYVADPKTGMWKGDYITGANGGRYVSEAAAMDVISKISPYNINDAIKTFK